MKTKKAVKTKIKNKEEYTETVMFRVIEAIRDLDNLEACNVLIGALYASVNTEIYLRSLTKGESE